MENLKWPWDVPSRNKYGFVKYERVVGKLWELGVTITELDRYKDSEPLKALTVEMCDALDEHKNVLLITNSGPINGDLFDLLPATYALSNLGITVFPASHKDLLKAIVKEDDDEDMDVLKARFSKILVVADLLEASNKKWKSGCLNSILRARRYKYKTLFIMYSATAGRNNKITEIALQDIYGEASPFIFQSFHIETRTFG